MFFEKLVCLQNKKIGKEKKYYKNREKIVDLEKDRRKIHKTEIDELKKKSQFNTSYGNVKIYYCNT